MTFSENLDLKARGRILSHKSLPDGHSHVVLDNGAVHTITLVCRTEHLGQLLSEDMKAIWEHMMTKRTGRFRRR